MKPPRPIEWFCLIGGLVLIFRYLWILDDAFVYYRYVDNLLFLGRGLVFNEGEYVEGYSSPLWALLLILLRSTGLDYWFITKALAVVFFVVFWALLVALNRRMSPDSAAVVNFPLACLAFAYGPLCYFASGLETPLVQVSAVLFGLFALSPRSRALQIVLAVTPLVRHELALPFVLFAAWSAWRTRRTPWLLLGAGAVFTGAWLIFRVVYYADLLPNTFYLKNDVNVAQGLIYVRQNLVTYAGPLLAAAVVLVVARLPRLRTGGPDPHLAERGIMLAGALAVTAYVIKIGGDPDHYRFVAFPLALAACSFAGRAEALVARLPARAQPSAAAALGLGVAALAFFSVPPQLEGHPALGHEGHRRVENIGDASWHRHHRHLRFDPRRAREDRARRAYYEQLRNRASLARYRTCTLCVSAYQDMGSRFVHRFGLTDGILAHTDARPDRPGHKDSLAYRARDLEQLLNTAERVDAGVFRRAVEAGDAPAWIRDGLPTIEVLARKAHNRHDLAENLRLAFTFPPRIHVLDWRNDPEDTGPLRGRGK